MRALLFFLVFSTAFAEHILLGEKKLFVEIADTSEKRAKGLMGREELKENEGMLFVYNKAKRLTFWMKDTLVPLSIGFFDEDKKLLKVLDMDPPVGSSLIKYRSTAPALYALEVPQGWFEKHEIHIGDTFSFINLENVSQKEEP